jgi:hypothetical protein
MKSRNILTAFALCGVAALAGPAHADETEYGGTFCGHWKSMMVQSCPEVSAFNTEF